MPKRASDFKLADVTRHWNSESEEFTGGDALVSMLNAGWRIRGIARERRHFSGARQTTIYHIQLERGGEAKKMHVLCNPYLTQLLSGPGLRVASGEAKR